MHVRRPYILRYMVHGAIIANMGTHGEGPLKPEPHESRDQSIYLTREYSNPQSVSPPGPPVFTCRSCSTFST